MIRGWITMVLMLIFLISRGQQNIDSLKNTLNSLSEDTNRVITLNNLAFIYYNISPDSAKIFSQEALKISRKLNYPRGIASSYMRIGVTYIIIGNLPDAISNFEKSITMADSIHDYDIAGRAFLNMGIASVNLGNNYKALEYSKRAKQNFVLSKNTVMAATADMNVGELYLEMGNVEEAEKYLMNSLQLEESKHPYLGLLLSNIAAMRMIQNRIAEADSLINYAWEHVKNSNNYNQQGRVQLQYARYYMAVNNFDKAEQHGNEALRLIIKANNIGILESVYKTMAEIEKKRKNISKAFEYLELRERYRDSLQSRMSIERARLFELKDQERTAILMEKELKLQQTKRKNQQNIFWGSFLIFGLVTTGLTYSIWQKQKTNSKLHDVNLKVRSKNDELEKTKRNLLELNNELKKREDQLQAANEELMQQQEEIATQYDAIAYQNDKLKEANELIAAQNENLENAVKQRTNELVEYNQQLEQYAFVTAHNLRAPVARILGLGNVLDFNKDDVQGREEIIKRMIITTRELDAVIHDLNEILEVRKNNTDIYSHVDLSEELHRVKNNLRSEIEQTNARIKEDFSEGKKLFTIKAYIDSILYNLISNAIKYRRANTTPVISVKTEIRNNDFALIISDNGIGFDMEMNKHKLFHLYGRFHDHVEGRGIGLFLVKTQVMALNGKITVESNVNEGTVFTILFKQSGSIKI